MNNPVNPEGKAPPIQENFDVLLFILLVAANIEGIQAIPSDENHEKRFGSVAEAPENGKS